MSKKNIILIVIMFFCIGIVVFDKNNTNIIKEEVVLGDEKFPTSYDKLKNKIIYFDLQEFVSTLPSQIEEYDYVKVAVTIQGLVNRKQPLIYYKYANNGFNFDGKQYDQRWFEVLMNNNKGFMNNNQKYTKLTNYSFYDLIQLAKSLGVLEGAVIWDNEVPATVNVANTIAGVENLVPIRYDVSAQSCYTDLITGGKLKEKRNLYNKFRNIGFLPDKDLKSMSSGTASTGSAKNDAYLWAKKYYLDTKKTSLTLMGYTRDAWVNNKCDKQVCIVAAELPVGDTINGVKQPNYLRKGETRQISVTILNNTSETFTQSGNYRLAAAENGSNAFVVTEGQYGIDRDGKTKEYVKDAKSIRVYIDPKNPISPGERQTITFTIKAPDTPGTYYLHLQFVHDGKNFYSGALKYEIVVHPSYYSSNKRQEFYHTYNGGVFQSGITNTDYLIQNKAFFFDLSPEESIAPIDDVNQKKIGNTTLDVVTLKSLFAQQRANNNNNMFTVIGFVPWFVKYAYESDKRMKNTLVATVEEWKMINLTSEYGGQTDADAAMPVGLTNASVFKHYVLENELKQNNDKEAIKSGAVKKEIYDPDTIYFAVFMGDFDCGAWTSGVYPSVFTYSGVESSKYPLMWPLATDLINRVPHAFSWLYKMQDTNDYFVTADNGTGYLNPMLWDGFAAKWKGHNINMNRRLDLDVTGFLIGAGHRINSNIQNAYAEMTPVLVGYNYGDGVANQKVGNTPFISAFGPDTGGKSFDESTSKDIGEGIYKALMAQKKYDDRNGRQSQFYIIRVVQVGRKKMYDAIDAAYAAATAAKKKIKIVDPYTMQYLYNNKKNANTYLGCYTDGNNNYQWVNGVSIPSGYKYDATKTSQNACKRPVGCYTDNISTYVWVDENGTVPKGLELNPRVSKADCKNVVWYEKGCYTNGKEYKWFAEGTFNLNLTSDYKLDKSITESRCFKIGDVNGDNKVDIKDYSLIRKHLIKKPTLTGAQLERAALIDGKTGVAVTDYIELRKKLIGNK